MVVPYKMLSHMQIMTFIMVIRRKADTNHINFTLSQVSRRLSNRIHMTWRVIGQAVWVVCWWLLDTFKFSCRIKWYMSNYQVYLSKCPKSVFVMRLRVFWISQVCIWMLWWKTLNLNPFNNTCGPIVQMCRNCIIFVTQPC